MVSTLRIAALFCSAIVAFGLPVALLVWWHGKTKAAYFDALVGALIFLVFAMVLEQILHSFVLKTSIVSKPWAFILYGSFAAGVFEETGRYIGFRFFMKKKQAKEDAIMYGIGHGGMESILIAGVSLVVSIIAVLAANAGHTDNQTFAQTARVVAQSPISTLFASGVERAVAICLHIALSVLVFLSIKRAGLWWMYPLAILFHAGVDSIAMLYRYHILKVGVMGLEGIVALATFLVCLFAFRWYRNDRGNAQSVRITEA